MNKMKIKEKDFRKYAVWAVVTGAASGMGRIYAAKLALMGYNLILVDINSGKLESAEEAIKGKIREMDDFRAEYASGFRTLCLVQDLSEQDAAFKIADAARKAECDVEVLINNAGMFFFQSIAEISRKSLSSIVMVHNFTSLMLCREFVPDMKKRGRGYVLNVSSIAAWMNWPGVGIYGDTKLFIKAFSRSLRIECRGTGVSVTTAYFGAVDTPLYKLSDKHRRIARMLRIMISPETAVGKALKAMFRRRRSVKPGFINKIACPLVSLLPDSLLAFLYKRADSFRMEV